MEIIKTKKCLACGQHFYINPKSNQTPITISKPNALLKMELIPWPEGIQETISHNFKCPASYRNRYTLKRLWFNFKKYWKLIK